MKRILFLAPLLLAGCTLHSAIPVAASAADAVGVPPPVTVANKTVLDEQLGRGAELLYKTFRLAVDTATPSLVHGPLATKLADIDNKAYSALKAVRDAYKAGNATSYRNAVDQVNAAISDGYAALGGK